MPVQVSHRSHDVARGAFDGACRRRGVALNVHKLLRICWVSHAGPRGLELPPVAHRRWALSTG
jgi:hypothetical protein